jgi:hypothetical protein
MVHPGAQEQAQEVRCPDQSGQQGDLVRGGVQRANCHERQGQFGDPVTELGDGLTAPEPYEAAIAPQ